jgi:hypothetical protein
MRDSLTKRTIPHEEARAAISRLVDGHFDNPGREHGRFGIPARPDYDDDLVLMAYVSQREAAEAAAPSLETRAFTIFESVRIRTANLPNCITGITLDSLGRTATVVLHDRTEMTFSAPDVAKDLLPGETADAATERMIYEAVLARQPATASH